MVFTLSLRGVLRLFNVKAKERAEFTLTRQERLR